MAWSPERRAILIGILLAVEGLASMLVGFASFERPQAALALLTGWLVAGCGLLAWLQVPGSRTGLLLVIAAIAWFIGGFRWVGLEALATLAAALSLGYAAVVTHAVLTFPSGRTADRRLITTIVVSYGAALVAPPIGQVLIAAMLLVGLVSLAAADALDRSHRRRPALLVGTGFAVVLVAAPMVRAIVPGAGQFDTRPIVELALIAVAAVLSGALVRQSVRRARVTDLVIELDPSRGGLTRELASAIGDPTLEVGYWLAESGRFVDPAGRPMHLPHQGDDRGQTLIERDRIPVAVLIHDPAVTADPAIRAATARAAELATVNARLQAESLAQAAMVDASRRRILEAADDERRDLDLQLRDRMEPLLVALEVGIASAEHEADGPDAILAAARGQLDDTRRDLAGLTEDLHPRVLDRLGLRGALEGLASRSAVPTALEWDAVEPAPEVKVALYFVCSEALANVAKHASATRVLVRVSGLSTDIVLTIEDDGHGGAAIGGGTGLLGLRDRVETLGGHLTVRSPVGGGTRLIATLPIGV